MCYNSFFLAFLFLIISLSPSYGQGLAEPSIDDESITIEIPQENTPLDFIFAKDYLKPSKTIRLNRITLTPEGEEQLQQKAELIADYCNTHSLWSQPSYVLAADVDVDLTMNNVPVLDQGEHGSCVTFATTAALNAIKDSGDFISQQCLLELGNTFEALKSSVTPNGLNCNYSGWDGIDYQCVFQRIHNHGVVPKTVCPHGYPLEQSSSLIDEKLSIYEYTQMSDNLWSKDFVTRRLHNPNSTLDVKRALNSGHRVLIGTRLNAAKARDAIGYPINGKKTGLWALPSDSYSFEEFINDIKNGAAADHALLITGYSDKKQVFKIRNSWGDNVGDNGDYYMTYSYYQLMNEEAFEISRTN